jgi:hypothetical protein
LNARNPQGGRGEHVGGRNGGDGPGPLKAPGVVEGVPVEYRRLGVVLKGPEAVAIGRVQGGGAEIPPRVGPRAQGMVGGQSGFVNFRFSKSAGRVVGGAEGVTRRGERRPRKRVNPIRTSPTELTDRDGKSYMFAPVKSSKTPASKSAKLTGFQWCHWMAERTGEMA